MQNRDGSAAAGTAPEFSSRPGATRAATGRYNLPCTQGRLPSRSRNTEVDPSRGSALPRLLRAEISRWWPGQPVGDPPAGPATPQSLQQFEGEWRWIMRNSGKTIRATRYGSRSIFREAAQSRRSPFTFSMTRCRICFPAAQHTARSTYSCLQCKQPIVCGRSAP